MLPGAWGVNTRNWNMRQILKKTKNEGTLKTQMDNSKDHTSNCLIFRNGCKEDRFPLAVVLAWNSK